MTSSSLDAGFGRVPDLLVRHCRSLDATTRPQAPARLRLEQTLGVDLARRLLQALTGPREL